MTAGGACRPGYNAPESWRAAGPAAPRKIEVDVSTRKTLDPADWTALRAQGHRMLDDMLDYLETIRDRPVWQPIPDEVRRRFRAAVPTAPSDLARVHDEFMRHILPF